MAAILERVSIPAKDGRPNVVVFDVYDTLLDNKPFDGAAQFLDAVESAGGNIVLVGSRQRSTEETDKELTATGLRRQSIRLLARPNEDESDILYKRELLMQLSKVAHVVAVFDDDLASLLAVELELPATAFVGVDTQIVAEGEAWTGFRQVAPAREAANELNELVKTIRSNYEAELPIEVTAMTGPTARRIVAQKGGLDAAIGLSPIAISAFADAQSARRSFLAAGVPRFPRLNAFERKHEAAFADTVKARAEELVAEMRATAYDAKLDTQVFEVDAAKRLYQAYGKGKRPANDEEAKVRLLANHALHPAATAITRLAFLGALDELAQLPEDDPKRTVFVTCGGCAAGKGNLTDLIKNLRGSFCFGAVWDAAGENDAEENHWVLEAAQQRGLKVVFGFVENDPMVQYNDVLGRAEYTGRIVDVVTFARSYINGQRNFRRFLSSPQYMLAKKSGDAEAIGLFAGPFNRDSLTSETAAPYPQARLLGQNGVIEAADVKVEDMPSVPAVASQAVKLFEQWTEQRSVQGKSSALFTVGALGNTMKFAEHEATEA